MTQFTYLLHNALTAYESVGNPQQPLTDFVQDFMGGNAEIVVRCKDCMFCGMRENGELHCESFVAGHKAVEPEDYCSWGARRGGWQRESAGCLRGKPSCV